MEQTRFIVAGNFLDGTGAEARRNVVLAVQGGVIAAIGSPQDLPGNDGGAIVDFSHCTLVPAWVDCSVFLARSPAVDPRVRQSFEQSGVAEKAALFERHARYCHAYGVLGVAENEDIVALVGQGRKVIDIRTADRGNRDRPAGLAGEVAAGGFLKIRYSGNIGDQAAPLPRLGPADLQRLLRNYRGGKKVVVANGRQAVAEALAAGCDAIEQGYLMGEENLREMAAKKVLWIPSVLRAKNGLDDSTSGGEVCCRFSLRSVAPGKPVPGAEAFWKRMLADQLAQLGRARELGVAAAVGTDAGSMGILHGESVVEEMKLFIRAGYSLAETVHCASEQGARFFAMEDLGALSIGRRATFLVTRGTPRQLPRKFSYLEGIYVDGAPSPLYHKDPVKAVY